MYFDIGLDLFPLLAATLAATCCGLLGNFLLLRKQSLMGDAISHSVLPGLVIAFLIVSTRSPLAMLTGATVAGVVTVVLIELVKRFGRVEPGAAMGVVFSILFALGVLLIEQAAVRHVDLDADCVLHGQLETLVWYSPPESWEEARQLRTWTGYTIEPAVLNPETGEVVRPALEHKGVPRQVTTLAIMFALAIGFVAMLLKELRLAAFDPALATTLGFNSTALHYLLMVFVAAATVASFEAVGSILVIAMLICPAATARLLTDRLRPQIVISVIVAFVTAVGGYFSATIIPALFELDALNAAGMMTVLAGIILTSTILFSPFHGVLGRLRRRLRLATRVAMDDLLSAMYRASEQNAAPLTIQSTREAYQGVKLNRAIKAASKHAYIDRKGEGLSLTPKGRRYAEGIVRRHRLWEHYLVDQVGLAPDHVHDTAERLEHLPSVPPAGPDIDPHGKSIPDEPVEPI
jgi:manganese/zinc/iron transport system permease protein